MRSWVARIAPLLVLIVLVFAANLALAGPPSAEQECLELTETAPGNARTIEACERAHAESPSPRTSAALAAAIAESDREDFARVYDLVREADSGEQTEPEVLALMLRASLANEEFSYAWKVYDRLADVAGDDWRLHALLFDVAIDHDRTFLASRHMRKLRRLDVPRDELESFEERYQEIPAWIRGIVTVREWLRIVALTWLALMLTTIGLGVSVAVLQRRSATAWTPRTADEPPPVPLRKVQAGVLHAFRLLYVSAMLMLALALVLFGLALCVGALMLPGILRATVLGIVVIDLAVILAILAAGLFRHVEPPGFRRSFQDEPELQQLSIAAASAMGVPPAVELRFTTDARIELVACPHWTLVIGIPLIDALDVDQFNALLWREYARARSSGGAGHFVAPLLKMVTESLATQRTLELDMGTAKWSWRYVNPGWYLLHGFHRLYRFMGSGAAREQDLLADRWAAAAHGSNRLADALVSHADVSVRFDASLVAIEAELPRRGWILANLFTHEPEPRPSEQALAAELDRRLSARDSLTDGMSLNARIARLEALVLPPPTSTSPQPLAQRVRGRDLLHLTATNAWRVALERKVNKFIRLEPELEAKFKP